MSKTTFPICFYRYSILPSGNSAGKGRLPTAPNLNRYIYIMIPKKLPFEFFSLLRKNSIVGNKCNKIYFHLVSFTTHMKSLPTKYKRNITGTNLIVKTPFPKIAQKFIRQKLWLFDIYISFTIVVKYFLLNFD